MDPVTFQVIQSRLAGIVREMQDGIFRTGYSTIVRETQDASCMLLDADGDVVGEHVILPLHITALPEVVRAVRATFDADIHPGDAFLTNHPFLAGVTHAIDIAVVTPVFAGDRLIAFCGSIAHKSDLGGVVPGTGYGAARELFQEGIHYPPVRYHARGELVRDVDAILRANSRTPELVAGDVRGQVGVARLGERRLHEIVGRYGLDALLATFAQAQEVAETRIRRALAAWPDGTSTAESWLDSDGIDLDRRLRVHVAIAKRGDRISFDFTDSADQAAGPVNIRPPLVRGCCAYALIATIDPGLSNNAGVARAIEMVHRPGSLLDPHYPAPTNAYMPACIGLTEALLDALAHFAPERRMARTGGVGGLSIAGKTAAGVPFVQYESVGSAYGGRASKDGVSGTAVLLSNTRTAPIEILENEFPTRIRRWELMRDSGGAGRFRGGNAARREWEILAPDAQLTARGARHAPALGVAGGGDGRAGAHTVNPGRPAERSLPSLFSNVHVVPGDRVVVEKAAGGGFGDPRARPFPDVVADVLDRFVSRDAAVAVYGADPAALDAAIAAWDGEAQPQPF